MRLLTLPLILTVLVINTAYSADILAIFPIASVSHNVVYTALTDELVARGHRLTIITTTPTYKKTNPNVVEIDFSFLYQVMAKLIDFNKWKDAQLDEIAMLGMWTDILEKYYDEQFKHPTIQEMIKKKDKFKFDAIIVEFMNQVPWQAFASIFNAPVIGISSLDMMSEYHRLHGNVFNPILHPEFIFPFYENLTFFQRVRVARYHAYYELYYKHVYNRIFDNVIKRHMGEIRMPVDQLNAIGEVLLINAHPALGHVRPVLPTTVQIGFMHVKEPKEIVDEKIKEFLDSSTRPVIYMSLGSMVKSSQISEATLNVFKAVFAELPYDVMWKYEKEEMDGKPDNVFAYPWFPQADLLAHKRVKLFITQGGQQSMEESIDRGVPLIVIPFAVDQNANALRIQKLGIGVPLDIATITKESLKAAIEEVMSGDYADNVNKLREIVHDEPMKPVDKAAWWVEYVIRHGGTLHLDYPGRHVPFWKYLMLDFIGIVVLGFHVIVKVLRFGLGWIKSRKTEKKKSKKGKSE
ncbi:UDP-glucosyltransferase 2-like [Chironomus tepperi]|uniref:UDP-glucosyltransferase 2-like n=1 Tax=Chironomus tepperi TaxID=113505 RepID=UPI00391F55DB